MTDCIFCRLIKKEIPSYPVYEDEYIYAFLDITQTTKGHTLVIPKQHVSDLFEYDEKLASRTFSKIPKIAQAIEKAFPDLKGLNLVNNNKPMADQTVFHSHIHLVPRYSATDEFKIHFSNHMDRYSNEEMTQIAHQISKEIQ